MADGRIVIDTKLDKSGLEQGLKGLQTVLKTGLASIGVASLGKIIGSIANETKVLNDSVRKASTLFGSVAVDTDNLKSKMTSLAIATGSSSEEIGEALYNALSAGVEVTEDMGSALSFVEKSIKTAKAGFADLASTVTATASVLNAYGMATKEADRVQGILLQTQNLGITTVAELSSTLAQVVPTASAFGVSFEQVGASLATMTAQGTKTAQATTSLNALLAELGKSGMKGAENLKKAGEYAGVGAKGFKELIDEGYTISDILQMMDKYAKSNNMSLVDMFGSIEAGKASLQLATGDGEKFNESLAKMADTAGLVEESFDKVLSNVDRLKNTFAEIKKVVGVEFASMIDASAGSLADLLEKIAFNGKEASLLESAFNNLTNAVSEYNQAQEEAVTASKDVGDAMTAQATIKLTNSLLTNIDLYNKSEKSIEKLKERNLELGESIKTASAGIEKMAKNFSMSVDEVARKYASGELLIDGALSDLVYAYEDGSKIIIDATAEIASNNQILAESENLASEYLKGLLQLYKDGAIDIDLFKMANYELYEAMMSYSEGYGTASNGYADIADDVEKLQNRLVAVSALMRNAEDKPVVFAKWAGYVDYLTEAISKAEAKIKTVSKPSPTGTPIDTTAPSSSYDTNPFRYDPPVTETDEFWKVYQKLNGELNKADEMYKLLGDEYDIVGAKTSAYQSALESLASAGVDMNRASVQKLIATYEDLAEEQEHLIAKQKLIDTTTDILSSSFKALSDSIGNIPNRLEELDQQMKQTNDALKDAENEKLDIEKEILDAKARGDAEAEEQAEKRKLEIEAQIQGYKNLKTQIEEDKKAVENGAESWKAFGKAGLLALAEILDSLGHQLTAQAVTALLSGNITGSILAGVGATTAYLASAGIKNKANSFASGGIVQQQAGLPPTGDNHVAFVNAGELILNQAQQANLADQIRAMSEGLRAGGNIIISLSGAHIYGLDEPAVGRAIYDNIERLRSEGVL